MDCTTRVSQTSAQLAPDVSEKQSRLCDNRVIVRKQRYCSIWNNNNASIYPLPTHRSMTETHAEEYDERHLTILSPSLSHSLTLSLSLSPTLSLSLHNAPISQLTPLHN
ncbi:hypothetical protein J6590_019919 [Homalodisca vitripennis]|nr:hypothetical protein J6590_019919 [Homalodisca vitripennis]